MFLQAVVLMSPFVPGVVLISQDSSVVPVVIDVEDLVNERRGVGHASPANAFVEVGKGVKLMIMVDAKGLPVAACTAAAGPHESHSVQELFDFMITSQKPERLIGDKAYDSDALDEAMAALEVEMIAPHRRNRRAENITQDARPLRRYRRRWKVERTIAWLQHFRRLCIRWEKSTLLFQGFVHFACTMLLLREVLG